LKIFFIIITGFIVNTTYYIREIKFDGLVRVERDVVSSQILFEPGQTIKPEEISETIKRLYNLGFFDSIEVDYTDGVVTFKFVERPILIKLTFSGNKNIKEDKLKEKIDIKTNQPLDKIKIENNRKKIQDYYIEEGFYLADVETEIKIEDGLAKVIFHINEGEKIKVKKIYISGNVHLSSSDIKSILT